MSNLPLADSSEPCYIDRTDNINQWEVDYKYRTVLVQVSAKQVPDATAEKYGVFLDERLEIHSAIAPHDFFLLLLNHASYLTILNGDRTVHTPTFQLLIRPWSRLAGVEHGALFHKVLIEMEGIPPHVWCYSMMAALMQPFCSIASIYPEIQAKVDLSAFQLTA